MGAVTNSRERRRFQEVYRQATLDMLVKVLDYVKLVKAGTGPVVDAAGSTMTPTVDDAAGSPFQCEVEDGFPKMPPPVANEEVTKLKLESVLREYLTAHYSE